MVADRLTSRQLEAICDSGADVMIVDFDRLVNRTAATLARLADRCGVAPFAAANAIRPVNPSVQARWMPFSALGKLAAVLLRRAGAHGALQRVKDSPAVRRLFFHGPEARPARPANITGEPVAPATGKRPVPDGGRPTRRGRQPGPGGPQARSRPSRLVKPLPQDPPAVSVVIPCRNAPGTIVATLDSIVAQRYDGPLEIIVADGSDDDRTARVIREAHPGVRVITQPPSGSRPPR